MERWHDLLAAQVAERPEAAAFSDSGGTAWSYAALSTAVEAVADNLRRVGVQPRDRVMVLSENCCAAVAAMLGASRIGAIAVPVNARMSAAEVDRILSHARPAAVLCTSAISPEAEAHAARIEAREIRGAFGTLHLACPYASNPDAPEEVAVLLYTTGTTGAPKGVMLTHANLLFGGKSSAELRDMGPGDVIYGVLPMTHVFGLASVMTAAILSGAEVWLEARFSAAKLYEALRRGVTRLAAVPQMHALVMQYAKEQGLERLGSEVLQYVSSGAAPLDPEWKRKAEGFYGVALQNGYGMTETTAGVCATKNSQLGDPDISTGPPMPGVEVRIDESVPGGGDGLGEVLARGPNIMLGYYRNPEETAKVLDAEGWMHTGDMGRLDARGFLHIEGRSKELIIHGGFNVFPPEVEAALNAHPQVVQSAVVGRRVSSDEEVLAFVQVVPGDAPDPAELMAFVRGQLAGYKCPALIVPVEALPAAPTGKILKHKLLETFADRLEKA
ncbi:MULTISPECIES: class I adenylate-forming enzyme family protein [Rhodobacterales]|jgi:acyl-CoA synthetase (AMP-forming)/AMP-acid ligase II|uniref:class I adenylate-forming enzyme family protein n=1 Tax=Rhodobacterales TaxID=204455 RepID=UPI00237F88B7|nr:class I adenylate-forming enzyme family protein [Phaeobacter gallaeciensis]MDE4140404.1 class I adenylate-forming enzyme family protein [Phaeobacter gallaeciensis]MDE4148903.1 class I adenylate-forming enzyme family protein [Phaeobacter gallaeciensis]MDE4153125.1 class I adenylate-forming enzyme family protein [Phaeobacter gallaeciensis]MDE4228461.1 class I adenylate-forming enzyme family protein [Phaeobacter gallaeciensis]MDE4257537.1 class I adenylate-forming enzyme family protein [Phaeob